MTRFAIYVNLLISRIYRSIFKPRRCAYESAISEIYFDFAVALIRRFRHARFVRAPPQRAMPAGGASRVCLPRFASTGPRCWR